MGVTEEENEGVGVGVGVAAEVALVGGCTGCWGVGNGDCQAEGDPGVGVGEPGGVLGAGRAGKSSFGTAAEVLAVPGNPPSAAVSYLWCW